MRKLIFNILYHLGVGDILRCLFHRNTVPILLFHRVSPKYDIFTQPIHPDAFIKIIELFSKKYSFKPLKNLFGLSKKEVKKVCFMAFDDATEDFETDVVPILNKFQLPVTQFVPTAPALNQTSIWNLAFFSMINYSSCSRFKIELENKTWQFDKR